MIWFNKRAQQSKFQQLAERIEQKDREKHTDITVVHSDLLAQESLANADVKSIPSRRVASSRPSSALAVMASPEWEVCAA